MGPFSSFFMCSCVLLPPGRFGPLRAEVVVGLGRVRLVQALLSSPSSAGLVPCPSSLRFFLFPCLFRVRPLGARFHVLVFSLYRRKTSYFAGGCRECHSSAANEDGYDILWYRSGTLDRRTCYQFLVNGNRLSQVPACRLFPFSFFGLCCIKTFLRTSV